MNAKCKLCGKEKKLLLSHIIPKFVYKWMQNSGGKFFRTLENPNVRKQDGTKIELLCIDCEQKLSKSEKWFSENIFYPYLERNKNIIVYGKELAHFIISVLWRVLLIEKLVSAYFLIFDADRKCLRPSYYAAFS